MNFRMLYDIMQLQNSVEAKDATIAELTNDVNSLGDCWRQLHECLDEKNKDIADLAQELRETKEKLSKSEAWNGKKEEE
jgi:peptidoglycan hydrolase CwlO-like protein|tara:strand:- start:617 stop:853 length:237 start_codon:yes stop_codon:yes gene_type:complete